MEIRKNFSSIFLEKIKRKLSILEIERHKAMNLFLLSSVFINILLFKFYKNLFLNNLYLIALAIITGIVALCHYLSFKKYKKSYKEKVMFAFFQEILTDVTFLPQSHLSPDDYHSTLLFQSQYDHFKGEDLIEGKLNGYSLRLSELHLKKTERHGKKKKTVTVFRGVMAIYQFPHQFLSETIIEPDIAEKILGKFLGNFLQETRFTRHQLVKLESPHFEKEFVVRSLDQVEARLILTPKMQETLTLLKTRNSFPFAFSISPGQMAFAASLNHNLFEAPVFKSCIETKTFQDIVNIFSFIYDVSMAIDQKTRRI